MEEVCRKVGKKGEYHKNMEPAIVELSVVVGGGFFLEEEVLERS